MAKRLYYADPATPGTTKEFLVDDIDAYDAVRRFPAVYSLEPPAKGNVEEVLTPLSAMAAGVNIPPASEAAAPATAATPTSTTTAATATPAAAAT